MQNHSSTERGALYDKRLELINTTDGRLEEMSRYESTLDLINNCVIMQAVFFQAANDLALLNNNDSGQHGW